MRTILVECIEKISPNLSLHNTQTSNKKTEIQDSKLSDLKQDQTSFSAKLSQINNLENDSFSEDVKFLAFEPTKQEKKKKLKEENLEKKFEKNCKKSTVLMKKLNICDKVATKQMMKILHDYHEILATGTKRIKFPSDLYESLKSVQMNSVFLLNEEIKKSRAIENPLNANEVNKIQIKTSQFDFNCFEDYIILRFYFHNYASWALYCSLAFGLKRSAQILKIRLKKLMLLKKSDKDHLAIFFENDPRKALNYKILSIDLARIDSFRPFLTGYKYDFRILVKTYGFLKTPWKQMIKKLEVVILVSHGLPKNCPKKEEDFKILNYKNVKIEFEGKQNKLTADENIKKAQVKLLFEIIEVFSKQLGDGFVILVKELIETSERGFSIGKLIELSEKLKKS